MYASVLVALDGSELAAEAVPHGLAIARQFGSCLILLSVVLRIDEVDRSDSSPDPARAEMNGDVLRRREYDARRSQAEGYLQGLTRFLGTDGVRVQSRLAEGKPAEVILETAKSLARPLIVITPNGRTACLTGSGTGAFGGVADTVLRGATGPVLVVRS
jgi:nucleotide-binding universal stress UspA family protein